jgi:hypothetical protein
MDINRTFQRILTKKQVVRRDVARRARPRRRWKYSFWVTTDQDLPCKGDQKQNTEEEAAMAYFTVLSLHFLRRTLQNHENFQPGHVVPRSEFEPLISQTQTWGWSMFIPLLMDYVWPLSIHFGTNFINFATPSAGTGSSILSVNCFISEQYNSGEAFQMHCFTYRQNFIPRKIFKPLCTTHFNSKVIQCK